MSVISQKVLAAVPFVLPVLGGVIGVLYVTIFSRLANPFLWVVAGVIAGLVLSKLIQKLAGTQQDVFARPQSRTLEHEDE